jgi:hypothetical protein
VKYRSHINNWYISPSHTRFIFLFTLLFTLLPVYSYGQSVYEHDGNIFFSDANGERTLTTSGVDSQPALSPDGKLVVFVRHTLNKPVETGSGDGSPDELVIMHLETNTMHKIVEAKPSLKMEEVLAGFSKPQFSSDSKSVYFLSKAWTTSAAIHKVDLHTKKVTFISPGNSLEVIQRGKYTGYLKVNIHRYHRGGGSYDCDYLLTPEGREVKVIEGSCDE